MKTKWKIAIGVGVLAIGGVAAFANYKIKQNAIISVTTATVARQDLVSLVTASGEIKPRNYINIGSNANAPARITEINVVEGQRVRKGQQLAKLESVQPEAQLAAQRAAARPLRHRGFSSHGRHESRRARMPTARAPS